jgi:hypothetical protein
VEVLQCLVSCMLIPLVSSNEDAAGGMMLGVRFSAMLSCSLRRKERPIRQQLFLYSRKWSLSATGHNVWN